MNDLERILRADARATIADGGFTGRVLAGLPAARPATPQWLRAALVGGSAALGSVLALVLAPGRFTLLEGFADATFLRGATPAAMTAMGICAALTVSVLVLAWDSD